MTGSQMPDDPYRYKEGSNILRYLILAILSILAIVGGIFVVFALTTDQRERTFGPDIAVSGTDNSEEMDLPEMPDIEDQLSNRSQADTVILVNSIEELDSNIAGTSPNPLLPKAVRSSTNRREQWTPTPLPTSTPAPTPSPIPTFVGELPSVSFEFPSGVEAGDKWIDVNLTSQTLVAYEGIKPVFESLVSSGTNRNPTVKGQFRIWLRFASQDMNGYRLGYDYFLQDVPYVQYFYEDYALHGTYWHNNFGTPMSHGCVNLPTPAAEWLFNWSSNGTLVNVHS